MDEYIHGVRSCARSVLLGCCFVLAASAAKAQEREEDPSLASSARGGPSPWVIVPVGSDGGDLRALAREAEAVLRRAGVPTADAAETSRVFERAHSIDPAAIGTGDIERWARSSREALHHLSRGDYQAARRALLEAQSISDRAAYALNRESIRARQVLDTCLYVVRAALETGDAATAELQTRRCRRLVPRIQASTYTHTPEVRVLVARVDLELAGEPTGKLTVESDRAGCIVRVNGVHFGTTPLTTNDLPQGEYRMQVECDEAVAGRVHVVSLGRDDVRIRIDSVFDRAVRVRPQLSLDYPTEALESAHAVAHARLVARALRSRVVLVRRVAEGLRFVAIDARARASAPLIFAGGSDEASLQPVAALFGASRSTPGSTDVHSDGVDGDSDVAHDDDEVDAEARGASSSTFHGARRAGSLSLLGAGAASLGSGIALVVVRSHRGREFEGLDSTDATYLPMQSELFRLRVGLDVSAAVGALASSVGASLAVRSVRSRHVFAWSGGIVGLGLVAWSAFEATNAPYCYGVPVCVEADRRIDRAVVIASFAGPSLSLPIAALMPRAADAEVDAVPTITAGLSVGPGRAVLSIGGVVR